MENENNVITNILLVITMCLCVVCLFLVGTTAAQVIMAIACACAVTAIPVSMGVFDECLESYEDEA